MTFGSLFAGIGGLDLGLERAGLRCVWQVELDPFCRKVLAKHWPSVPKWDDVRAFTGEGFERPDVICGGFPCQDISNAGKRAGIDGERSGLWSEYARLIGLFRPRFVVVENVAALLIRGVDRVCGDLAAIGYDAEWQVVGAHTIGASQRRKRLWILAYPDDPRREGPVWVGQPAPTWEAGTPACGEPLRSTRGYWPPGPRAVDDIPRMADGPANRVDRLRALGNAVVPQVAEWIGRRLMQSWSLTWSDPNQEARMGRKFTDLPPTHGEDPPMFAVPPDDTPPATLPMPTPRPAAPAKPANPAAVRRQNPDLQAVAKIDRILSELTITAACRALAWLVDSYREKASGTQADGLIDSLPRSL